jgi:hypothetical protein
MRHLFARIEIELRKAGSVKRIIIFLIVLLVTTGITTQSSIKARAVTGTWGGNHIRIEVGNGSGRVEFDCANGTITGPLSLKRNGEFSWRGYFTPEHGGPSRDDEASHRKPATYSGSINGDTMTLTVRLAGARDKIDSYILKKGSEGRVFKCL